MSICMDCGGPTTGRNKLCATCKENRRRAQKLRYAAKRRERATEEAQKKEQLQRPVKKLVGNGLDAVLFRLDQENELREALGVSKLSYGKYVALVRLGIIEE